MVTVRYRPPNMPRKKLTETISPTDVVTTVDETPTPAPKPSRSRRTQSKPTQSAPVASDVIVSEPEFGDLVVEFRAREPRSAGRKSSPKPVAAVVHEPEAVVEAAPLISDPIALEIEPGEEIVVSFRASNAKAKTPQPSRPTAPKVEIIEFDAGPDGDLPVPIWRPSGTPKPIADDETVPVEARPNLRDRRRRGSKVAGDAPEIAPAPTVITVKPSAEPVVVVKPPIVVPEAAPRVHMRNGVPTLVREHRVYPPLFFHSGATEGRGDAVFEEIKMASESGIHLISHRIDLMVEPATVATAIGRATELLDRTVAVDGDAQVSFRVYFRPPATWQDKYPKARYRLTSGSIAEPSICDDEYWSVAEKCLVEFIGGLRQAKNRDHVLGIHLDRGGEWALVEGGGYDDSVSANVKFRDWARVRYQNDEVTLQASWFDGRVRFDSIRTPEFRANGDSADKFIRSSRKQREIVDYHLFLSDATVHRIAELAYAAKSASEGFFLVGVSYGYTFEWSHPYSGHLSLGKLLRTPEIDYIAGPPSYRDRQPGGSGAFPCPIDSFALNGKLFLSEDDFKTSLGFHADVDDANPPLKTPQALESVHWRGAGSGFAHAAGAIWMDSTGAGSLKTGSVWSRAAKVADTFIQRMGANPPEHDVAVFIDERALGYLVDSDAFQLLVQNVRASVLRAGVSAGFYLLSDLAFRDNFPESKLYLFLNAWDIRPELRAAIKSKLQRDDKVLFWLYSAGLFDAGRDSLERAREVTGIALKPQPFYSKSGTTIVNRRHPLAEAFPDRSVVGDMKLEPSYFAIPENALVLGEYTQTGLPSFIVKEITEGDSPWTSVFLGEPLVSPELVRALAQLAKVHVWNFNEDVVHVRTPFLTVHCTGGGMRTIALPDKFAAYDVVSGQWAQVEGTSLRFIANDGSTHVFLVGPRIDVEHLLGLDRATLLEMAEYPEVAVESRHEMLAFDVPLMKLDEWIGGNESDEVADEWFLRAPTIVEEPEAATEAPDRVGRRRRKRGGKTGRGGDDSGRGGEATPFSDADLEMNIVFRKRD